MSLTIELPAEVEERLRAAAAAAGVTPEKLASDTVEARWPVFPHQTPEQRAALSAFLRSWLEAADGGEDEGSFDEFAKNIDAARPGQRPHFPPDLKGKTW